MTDVREQWIADAAERIMDTDGIDQEQARNAAEFLADQLEEDDVDFAALDPREYADDTRGDRTTTGPTPRERG